MSYVQISGLTKAFPLRGRTRHVVRAVTDVSFAIPKGKTYGLVGESGSGKSTVAQMIVGLVNPDSGTVEVGGQALSGDRAARGRYLQQLSIVFQSPFSSLDPKMTVLRIVGEPLRAFRRHTEAELEARVGELLQIVGLAPEHMFRYPHEFSGGQRQRIAIARAIAVNPSFLGTRRTYLGARRLGAGTDRQPAGAAAGGRVAHLPLHLAQHRRRPPPE